MSEALKIEDGIPIPEAGTGRPKSPLRIAMEAMRPKQSVVIHRDDHPTAELYKMAKKVGITIATRQVNGDSRRIWRIK